VLGRHGACLPLRFLRTLLDALQRFPNGTLLDALRRFPDSTLLDALQRVAHDLSSLVGTADVG